MYAVLIVRADNSLSEVLDLCVSDDELKEIGTPCIDDAWIHL
eukprot:SAG11_NODE_29857_length_306_cov_0.995169_1_plen_41_part_01